MTAPGMPGWRSARWRRTAGSAPPTALAGAMPGVPTMMAGNLIARVRAWPWQGVAWSISYVAFLYYIAVIVTYNVPGATWAMALALAALPFQKDRIAVPPLLLVFGVFWIIAVCGYFTTPWKPDVYKAIVELGKVWLITLVGVNVLRTRAHLRFFIFFFLACFALYPLRGAYYNILFDSANWGRIAWNYIYDNPNDLSAYAFLPLCLSAGLLYVEQNRILRWAAKIGIGLIAVLTFFTQSRGAFIALGVTAIIAILGMKQRLKYFGMLTGLAIIIAIAAPKSTWERFAGLQHLGTSQEQLMLVDPEGSALQRYEVWKTATRITAKNPALGVGLGGYKFAHAVESASGITPSLARGMRDTHSTYLNVLAETGVLGAIAFFSIFLVAVAGAHRVRRRLRKVNPGAERQIFLLELGLLAFALAAVFGTYVMVMFTYLYVILLHGLTNVAQRELRAMSTGPAWRR